MTTLVQRFLHAAGSPRNMRAALRDRTRTVRHGLRLAQPVHEVGAAWPKDVLGHELIDLLSDAFKRQLAEPAPANASDEERRTARPLDGMPHVAPAPSLGADLFPDAWQRTLRASAPFAPELVTKGRASRPSETFAGESDYRLGRRDPRPVGQSHRAQRDRAQPTVVSPTPTQSDPLRASQQHNALRAALHDYWHAVSAAQARTVGAAQTEPMPAREPSAPADRPQSASPHARNRAFGAWPGAVTRSVAERSPDAPMPLTTQPRRAFVLGPMGGRSGSMTGALPFDDHNASAVDGRFDGQADVHADLRAPEALTHTLADRVAEILRDQALNHGIDIT